MLLTKRNNTFNKFLAKREGKIIFKNHRNFFAEGRGFVLMFEAGWERVNITKTKSDFNTLNFVAQKLIYVIELEEGIGGEKELWSNKDNQKIELKKHKQEIGRNSSKQLPVF